MNCPSCNNELQERGSFCKACGAQARCTNCREMLEPNATVCVECGTRIRQPDNAEAEGQGRFTIAPNRNTLNFQEDKNSRKFEASLTDDAITSLGGVFGYLFVQRGTSKPPQMQREKQASQMSLLAPNPNFLSSNHEPEEAVQPETAEPAKQSAPSPERERILNVFSAVNEDFELSDNRLKASHGADYLKRLTYLYLYAHETFGRQSALESDLKNVLRSAKIIDRAGNAVRWLNKRVGIVPDGEDRVKLNAKGREEAKKVLDETLDAKFPDTWNPDNNSPKRRKKKA